MTSRSEGTSSIDDDNLGSSHLEVGIVKAQHHYLHDGSSEEEDASMTNVSNGKRSVTQAKGGTSAIEKDNSISRSADDSNEHSNLVSNGDVPISHDNTDGSNPLKSVETSETSTGQADISSEQIISDKRESVSETRDSASYVSGDGDGDGSISTKNEREMKNNNHHLSICQNLVSDDDDDPDISQSTNDESNLKKKVNVNLNHGDSMDIDDSNDQNMEGTSKDRSGATKGEDDRSTFKEDSDVDDSNMIGSAYAYNASEIDSYSADVWVSDVEMRDNETQKEVQDDGGSPILTDRSHLDDDDDDEGDTNKILDSEEVWTKELEKRYAVNEGSQSSEMDTGERPIQENESNDEGDLKELEKRNTQFDEEKGNGTTNKNETNGWQHKEEIDELSSDIAETWVKEVEKPKNASYASSKENESITAKNVSADQKKATSIQGAQNSQKGNDDSSKAADSSKVAPAAREKTQVEPGKVAKENNEGDDNDADHLLEKQRQDFFEWRRKGLPEFVTFVFGTDDCPIDEEITSASHRPKKQPPPPPPKPASHRRTSNKRTSVSKKNRPHYKRSTSSSSFNNTTKSCSRNAIPCQQTTGDLFKKSYPDSNSGSVTFKADKKSPKTSGSPKKRPQYKRSTSSSSFKNATKSSSRNAIPRQRSVGDLFMSPGYDNIGKKAKKGQQRLSKIVKNGMKKANGEMKNLRSLLLPNSPPRSASNTSVQQGQRSRGKSPKLPKLDNTSNARRARPRSSTSGRKNVSSPARSQGTRNSMSAMRVLSWHSRTSATKQTTASTGSASGHRRQGQESSKLKQAFPVSSPMKQAFPVSSPMKQAFPVSSPMKQALPVSSPRQKKAPLRSVSGPQSGSQRKPSRQTIASAPPHYVSPKSKKQVKHQQSMKTRNMNTGTAWDISMKPSS